MAACLKDFLLSHIANNLHIISLDNPIQPSYGGVIDIHYKARLLHESGIKVHLHTFYRGNQIHTSKPAWIHYLSQHPRRNYLSTLFSTVPFPVSSRHSDQLFRILAGDNYPVLMEGIHSSSLLHRLKEENPARKIFLRAHNDEAKYYRYLAGAEGRVLRKLYLMAESFRLRRYEEKCWPLFDAVFAISRTEAEYISKFNSNTFWLPAFFETIANRAEQLPGESWRKPVLLYHANFRIAENRKAAHWLLKQVQPLLKEKYHLLIAGRSIPSGWKKFTSAEFIDNPASMKPVFDRADLVVLPGWQDAGVKLKFLQSVSAGKKVLCMEAISAGSGIEIQDLIFKDAAGLAEKVEAAIEGRLDDSFVQQRNAFESVYRKPERNQELLRMIREA